jgi:hypothetical protein
VTFSSSYPKTTSGSLRPTVAGPGGYPRQRPGELPPLFPRRRQDRLDQLAGRRPRGLHGRHGRQRRRAAHLLGRRQDPGNRLDRGRRGPRGLRRGSARIVSDLGLRDPARRRAAAQAAVRPGYRPGPGGDGHGPAHRPDEHRARVLEALPRRHPRPAVDRHRSRPAVHPGAGRPGRPAGRAHADRGPAVLPVRSRGHRQRLLVRAGRQRPDPAHRPRRHVRAEPGHGRAADRLSRGRRHLDPGLTRGGRAAPARGHAGLPGAGPRPAAGLRARSPGQPGL